MDTSGATLPSDLQDLVEVLARNTHDLWARKRISEGWTHGPHRDDAAKKHPDLIPYEDLAEVDKDYDRETVVEALRAVIKLGYTIEQDETGTDGH